MADWKDEYPDDQGGVTSELGFRLVIDDDGQLAVVDIESGKRYLRPDEAEEAQKRAESEAEARHQAEERLKKLQEELDRLRQP